MKYIMLLFFLFSLAACQTPLKDDPTAISAPKAGYTSAELITEKGHIRNGLYVTSVTRGSNYANLNLRVQGYYDGRIRFTSTQCGFDTAINYTKSQALRVPFKGIADRDCLVVVTVSPHYPGLDKSGIEAFPLTGWFLVKVLDRGTDWLSITRKVSGNWSSNWQIETSDTLPVRVYLTGCGLTFDQNVTPKNGIVIIPVHQVVKDKSKVKICTLDGVIISQEFSYIRLSALINVYDTRYSILSIPSMSVASKKITVKADDAVTAIGYNEKIEIGNTAKFDFKGEGDVVRVMTVKGRTVYGQYRGGAWRWQQ